MYIIYNFNSFGSTTITTQTPSHTHSFGQINFTIYIGHSTTSLDRSFATNAWSLVATPEFNVSHHQHHTPIRVEVKNETNYHHLPENPLTTHRTGPRRRCFLVRSFFGTKIYPSICIFFSRLREITLAKRDRSLGKFTFFFAAKNLFGRWSITIYN